MQTTKTPSKIVVAATTLALTWTLTGCATDQFAGGTTSDSEDQETESTFEPTDNQEEASEPNGDATANPESGDDGEHTDGAGEDEDTGHAEGAGQDDGAGQDGSRPGIDEIPLPDGALVIDSQSNDVSGLETVLAHVPGDWPQHADFYREALPAAGWTIEAEDERSGATGTVFQVSSGLTYVWISVDNFDGGTALDIGASPLNEAGFPPEDGAGAQLPDGFPTGVELPLYTPSEMMTGTGEGTESWVLEYQTTADIPTVEAAIEQQIADKNWTITDERPEGEGTHYVLEKPGMELDLVVMPERVEGVDTSVHYTLRFE